MTMQESTVPIWIPSWDEYPEILSILDSYERKHESFGSTKTVSMEQTLQESDQFAVVSRVMTGFLQETLSSFPVSRLINRLGVWRTENATAVSLAAEDLNQLWQYVCRLPSADTGCELALPDEEYEFCEQHGLFHYLPVAEKLLKIHFPNALLIQPELMKDPDGEAERLVIGAKVNGEIDAVLDAYDRLTRDWVAAVPWPDREKILIDYSIM